MEAGKLQIFLPSIWVESDGLFVIGDGLLDLSLPLIDLAHLVIGLGELGVQDQSLTKSRKALFVVSL